MALGEAHRSIDLLKDLLESERAEKEYFRDLLLTKAGLIRQVQPDYSLEDMEPVRRRVSLSSLRQQASEYAKQQAQPATTEELTEAENTFEKELGKVQ